MIRRFRWSTSERAMVRDALAPVLRRDAATIRTSCCPDGTPLPQDIVANFAAALPRGRAVQKALRRGDEIALTPVTIGFLLEALAEAERSGVADWDVIHDLRARLHAIDISFPQGNA